MAIRLHEGQSRVYRKLFVDKKTRFESVCCSRGWGKSFLGASAVATAVAELTALPANVPNKNVYIIAPTYEQVTDIYYPLLKHEVGLGNYAIKDSQDAGRFWFPRNVQVRLLSYEAIERMRGKGAYFVLWDEVTSCKKGIQPKAAWEGIIQPCIVTRWSVKRAAQYGAVSPGRALAISTPKGFDFFHDMCSYHETDPLWGYEHFDYTTSPFLDATEIERIKRNLDPLDFASEYKASFIESGNAVFYCFDRKSNVKMVADFAKGESIDDSEVVHVNIDFNVGLMCSTAMALRGGEAHIIHEYKGHPDTETLAKTLKETYRGHRILAYPDPSGRARKTSAPVGQTDFAILERHGIQCLAHKAAPPIVDSVQAVNRMLMNAKGEHRLLVHPRCTNTVISLERTKWVDNNPNIAAIDKSEGVEHFSDGLRYGIEFNFPVSAGYARSARGFGF